MTLFSITILKREPSQKNEKKMNRLKLVRVGCTEWCEEIGERGRVQTTGESWAASTYLIKPPFFLYSFFPSIPPRPTFDDPMSLQPFDLLFPNFLRSLSFKCPICSRGRHRVGPLTFHTIVFFYERNFN